MFGVKIRRDSEFKAAVREAVSLYLEDTNFADTRTRGDTLVEGALKRLYHNSIPVYTVFLMQVVRDLKALQLRDE